MLIFALVFGVLAVYVLGTKKPVRGPGESTEYRIDNRVVGFILGLMAIGFAVLAWTTGKYFDCVPLSIAP